MLDELFSAIFEEIIVELIWNLILKPLGLLLYYIFKFIFMGIFNFGKWNWKHIAAVGTLIVGLFKRKDGIEYGKSPYYGNGYSESDYVNSSSDLND